MHQAEALKRRAMGSGLGPLGVSILGRLAQGLSMREVARDLEIPLRTVAFHKYRIMEANGLRSSADLNAFAARLGSVPPSS